MYQSFNSHLLKHDRFILYDMSLCDTINLPIVQKVLSSNLQFQEWVCTLKICHSEFNIRWVIDFKPNINVTRGSLTVLNHSPAAICIHFQNKTLVQLNTALFHFINILISTSILSSTVLFYLTVYQSKYTKSTSSWSISRHDCIMYYNHGVL